MKLDLFWVDAFSRRPFGGNPAAVLLLESWLPDELMQAIATENGLPMTAFSVRTAAQRWHIRWFSPSTEVALCGHATLATAFVLLELLKIENQVVFESQSGALAVARNGHFLELDFPANPSAPEPTPPGQLLAAFRVESREWRRWNNYYVAILATPEEVLAVRPDFTAWLNIGDVRLVVSAPAQDCDFVSRFFAPGIGIAEDSVTGSSHCVLVPYWSERLKRPHLTARQLSLRGGELACEWAGERVKIAGQCALYMRGQIEL